MTSRKKPLSYYNRRYRGSKYHQWTILGGAERRPCGGGLGFGVIWMKCRCACGTEGMRRLSALRDGDTKRCRGCKDSLLRTGVDQTVFQRIKKDAVKRGYAFSITLDYIDALFEAQKGRCALSGVSITRPRDAHEYRSHHCTASLDRRDNTRGYVKGNVQWVHKVVNIMKLTHDQGEFVEWCRRVAQHHSTGTPVAPASDDPNQPPVG